MHVRVGLQLLYVLAVCSVCQQRSKTHQFPHNLKVMLHVYECLHVGKYFVSQSWSILYHIVVEVSAEGGHCYTCTCTWARKLYIQLKKLHFYDCTTSIGNAMTHYISIFSKCFSKESWLVVIHGFAAISRERSLRSPADPQFPSVQSCSFFKFLNQAALLM